MIAQKLLELIDNDSLRTFAEGMSIEDFDAAWSYATVEQREILLEYLPTEMEADKAIDISPELLKHCLESGADISYAKSIVALYIRRFAMVYLEDGEYPGYSFVRIPDKDSPYAENLALIWEREFSKFKSMEIEPLLTKLAVTTSWYFEHLVQLIDHVLDRCTAAVHFETVVKTVPIAQLYTALEASGAVCTQEEKELGAQLQKKFVSRWGDLYARHAKKALEHMDIATVVEMREALNGHVLCHAVDTETILSSKRMFLETMQHMWRNASSDWRDEQKNRLAAGFLVLAKRDFARIDHKPYSSSSSWEKTRLFLTKKSCAEVQSLLVCFWRAIVQTDILSIEEHMDIFQSAIINGAMHGNEEVKEVMHSAILSRCSDEGRGIGLLIIFFSALQHGWDEVERSYLVRQGVLNRAKLMNAATLLGELERIQWQRIPPEAKEILESVIAKHHGAMFSKDRDVQMKLWKYVYTQLDGTLLDESMKREKADPDLRKKYLDMMELAENKLATWLLES